MISIIAVIGKNRELGRNNKLLWEIPDDMRHFKRLTMGRPVIMGSNTFESIGCPLPGRFNIVLNRNKEYRADGCKICCSIDEAIQTAKEQKGGDEIFIIGGGEIYRQTISMANKLYLTLVDDAPQADTFFPNYSDFNNIVSEEDRKYNGIRYKFIELIR